MCVFCMHAKRKENCFFTRKTVLPFPPWGKGSGNGGIPIY